MKKNIFLIFLFLTNTILHAQPLFHWDMFSILGIDAIIDFKSVKNGTPQKMSIITQDTVSFFRIFGKEHQWKYVYNFFPDGKIKEYNVYREFKLYSKLHLRESFEYNKKNLISVVNNETEVGYKSADYLKRKYSYEYSFDKEQKIFEQAAFLDSKPYALINAMEYDSLSRLVRFQSKVIYKTPNISSNHAISIKYNTIGNIISVLQYSLDKDSVKNFTLYLYDYDASGLIVRRRMQSGGQSITNSQQEIISVDHKYEYKSDKRGNWIKRYLLVNGKRQLDVKREITYY